MSNMTLSAAVIGSALLAGCAASDQKATVANNRSGPCRTVYVVGTHIPQKQCTPTEALSDFEKERLRRAMGGPIVTETDIPMGDPRQ
jgi:hypothetical protein